MKKRILLPIIFMLITHISFSQVVYKDAFSNDFGAPVAPYWGTPTSGAYTVEHTSGSGTTTITSATSGTFKAVPYSPYDNPQMGGTGGAIASVNMSGTNDTIFIVAKSTVNGTKLRVDIKDVNDHVSDFGTITNELTLTTTYAIYKFYYPTPQNAYSGVSGCTSGTPCTVDKSQIKDFVFYIDATTGTFNGTVTLDYFQVGGDVSTVVLLGNKNAALDITSSKIYPNPSSEKTTVDLSLKTVSEVKVTLTDLFGKQVDAIEATTSEFTGSFNTANLAKGVYTVNYFINNAPVKAELLMVK